MPVDGAECAERNCPPEETHGWPLLTTTGDDRRGEIVVFAQEQFGKSSRSLDIAVMEAASKGIPIHSVIIPQSASSLARSGRTLPQQQLQHHSVRGAAFDVDIDTDGGGGGDGGAGDKKTGVLAKASAESGGKSVELNDIDGNAPVHAVAEMLEALEKIIPPTNTVKVYQELKVPLRETMTIEDTFPVDSSPGGEFLVRVHSKEVPRQVSIVSPQGETPEPHASSEGGIRAPVLQTIRVQPWPSPSTGQWTYKIQAVVPEPVLVEVWMPFGAGSSQDEVIAVEGWTSWDGKAVGDPTDTSLTLYARVTVGQRAVRFANVVASVKRTTKSYSDEVQVLLSDDGLGDPDSTKSDGVYSGYFTGFLASEQDVKYQITWVATATDGGARVPTIVGREPKLMADDSADPSGLSSLDICCEESGTMTALPAFKRILPGPTFTVPLGPVGDVYPPNRILDLRARVDVGLGVFHLAWTAPGGNYNHGIADKYELRYSSNRSELWLEHGGTVIPTPKPGPAGKPEHLDLQVGQFGLEPGTRYHFAIRATHGRQSRMSNAVVASLPVPITDSPPLDNTDAVEGPTRGTFALPSDVMSTHRATFIVIAVAVVSFVFVAVALILCVTYCVRRRHSKAALDKPTSGQGGVGGSVIVAPDVVASLDAKPMQVVVDASSPVTADEVSSAAMRHQFVAASQILDSHSCYYGDQQLVSSSDRMSYQSSQQSDTNSSHSDTKKFVHFSADTLSAGGGVHNYGYPGNQQQLQQTQQPGFKGPPPPVPPKPAYGDVGTRLNESHCSVGSVDHKKVRTVTQV
ncbi:unnamed protein product [Notodromas monacha]|uniref:Fibronectin type-III domain-containing protein n=1 Tax=Notodromas monacha TaxID=399045 RepID=A0A7R9BPS8_9CRUS|nr:unnamed protein product [Notodromas monacha]CAG0918347.1 unnamed protein product [Notodromas monacha]